MIHHFNIRTIDGQIYRFYNDDIYKFNFDYTPKIIRFDFKDGSFIAFYKQNVAYVEAIAEKESKNAESD